MKSWIDTILSLCLTFKTKITLILNSFHFFFVAFAQLQLVLYTYFAVSVKLLNDFKSLNFFLNHSPFFFTLYYHNLATVTYFPLLFPCSPGTRGATCCTPTHTKPLKRIIYIAQVWDQSNFSETLEYTNLRPDIYFAEGRKNCESHRERERE